MEDLFRKFTVYTEDNQLIQPGDRIILGVSGGVDSMVLLHLMIRISGIKQVDLLIAHLNHGLRKTGGARDEAFVVDVAKKTDLPVRVHHVDTAAHAEDCSYSIEEAARELRFTFFTSLLDELRYTSVALGHHADDQAETVLLNLLRGSGPQGLSGIKPKRDSIIHPLLFATRDEITSYALKEKIAFVEDETNSELVFQRNRIRHRLIPYFEEAMGRPIVKSICRAADLQNEVNCLVEESAQLMESSIIISSSPGEIILDINNFLTYLKAVQKRFLKRCLKRLSGRENPVGYHELERFLTLMQFDRPGAVLHLNCGVSVTRGVEQAAIHTGTVVITRQTVRPDSIVTMKEIGMKAAFDVLQHGVKPVFTDSSDVEYLDFDKIPQPLLIRGPLPGDRFYPLGMTKQKKLQDFFIDEKVEVFNRSRIPLLLGGSEIICVLGHRIDNRYKVSPGTKKILKISIVRG